MSDVVDWTMVAATVCVPVTLSALGGLWVLANRLTKAENAAGVAKETAAGANSGLESAHKRIDAMAAAFAEFREKVARDYVSQVSMDKFEVRIGDEFKYIRDAIDGLRGDLHSARPGA